MLAACRTQGDPGMLIQCANADIPNPLSVHGLLLKVKLKSLTPGQDCQVMQKMTLF